MPAVFPVVGYSLLGLFITSAIALIIGWRHPERVLPKAMHPTKGMARIVYAVLTAWLLGGAIVFLWLGSVLGDG